MMPSMMSPPGMPPVEGMEGSVPLDASAPEALGPEAYMDTPPAEVDERAAEVANSFFDRAREILSREEKEILLAAIEDYPVIYEMLEKVWNASGGEVEGEVSGPGTGTSDSIDAKLSDGEFVFTSKAVKQIGVDKLRKMLNKAEQEYDAALAMQDQAASGDPEMGFKRGGLMTAPGWVKYKK